MSARRGRRKRVAGKGIGLGTLLILGGAGYAAYKLFVERKAPAPTAMVPPPTPTPTITPEMFTLTGMDRFGRR